MAVNKITEKTVIQTPGTNAHVLITQDATVNGETVQAVRRIEMADFIDAFLDVATDAEIASYLGIDTGEE